MTTEFKISPSFRQYFICLIALFVCSCQKNNNYFPQNLPATDLNFIRFDSAFLSLNTDTNTLKTDIISLYDKYTDFMPVFTEDILGIDRNDTNYLLTALPQFLEDTVYGFKQTNLRTKELFCDIKPLKNATNTAFARLKYLYPELTDPQITLFISGFNASLFFWEAEDDYLIPEDEQPTRIAVGVDMYLGSDYEYYNRVVYNYQKQTMRPECIPVDIMSAYLFHTFPYTSSESRLLENMIYRGKLMYLLSLLFPDETEAEIMGYTQQQYKWAKKYEAQIWKHILDSHALFSTESPVLSSYLNDGPFTAEVSQDAPPRLGTWIGWQIAKSYIENNRQISLQNLLEEGDAQKILEFSNYRP